MNRSKAYILGLYFLLIPLLALPQSRLVETQGEYSIDSIASFNSANGFAPSLFYDLKTQGSSPFKFSKKDWAVAGVTVGVTSLLINFDSEIDEWARVQKQRNKIIGFVSPQITQLGSNAGIYAVGAFGFFSAITHNNKGLQTSLLATQAMITSGVWTHIIKALTLRERPDQTYRRETVEGGRWYGPQNLFDNHITPYKSLNNLNAFTSGHTATVFSIATVIASEYKDQKAIPIISYGLASMAGLSRLTEHKHWASDVFSGAALGYFCGKQVVKHFEKVHQYAVDKSYQIQHNSHPANLSIVENGNQLGLRLSWK